MNSVKCGLALVAGYVLGRTKKAKAAIGLGLWVSGRNHHAKDVLRDQAVRLARSAEGEQLINQIRGPAVEAGRRAAVAVYEAKLGRLTDALAERTERLTSALGDSAKTVREGAGAVREGAGAAREGAGAVRETVGGVVGSAVPGRGLDRDGDGQRSAGGGEEDEQRAPGGAEAQQSRSAEAADTDQDESSEPGRAAEPDESGSGEGKPEPAGERRVPDRSVGRRQAARRDPMEKVAAGSTGGESS